MESMKSTGYRSHHQLPDIVSIIEKKNIPKEKEGGALTESRGVWKKEMFYRIASDTTF